MVFYVPLKVIGVATSRLSKKTVDLAKRIGCTILMHMDSIYIYRRENAFNIQTHISQVFYCKTFGGGGGGVAGEGGSRRGRGP